LKAIAYRSGYINSAVVSGTYTVATKVATPTFAPDGQTSSLHSVSVRISCSTSGATIRYTTDGSTPTSTHGTIITSGSSVTIFPPAAGMTLKAIGYKSGLTNSAVKSAVYYWDPSGGVEGPKNGRPLQDGTHQSLKAPAFPRVSIPFPAP